MKADTQLILADELHRRLHIQARNLLFEYRLSSHKSVPVEQVENLMRLYGNLIAQLIFEDQEKARKETPQLKITHSQDNA